MNKLLHGSAPQCAHRLASVDKIINSNYYSKDWTRPNLLKGIRILAIKLLSYSKLLSAAEFRVP